jgi:peroxiredoxin (alkyl hydroperoxide reductase subunit C)
MMIDFSDHNNRYFMFGSIGKLAYGPLVPGSRRPDGAAVGSGNAGEAPRRAQAEIEMSLINTEIKPFKATAFKAGKFIDVSEASLKGKWSVVFFYPADFTFVCPTELEDLADNYAEFQKLGVEIYAVSTDTHFSHKAWHDHSPAIKKIQYTMVGDPTGTITRNFDVMIEADGLADRGTFVVDPAGKIQIVEVTAGGIGRDARELLRKVKAAQYVASHPGEVCPAKWQEGAKTLAPSLDLVGKI